MLYGCLSIALLLSWCACTPTIVSKKLAVVSREKVNSTKARVIIDAGHGGKDTGAVGKRGLLEKSVTLDIAKRLQHLIQHHLPGVDAVLTRSNDQFVSLEERIQIAHQKHGDLFLSLHINSSESKNAQGFEIYSLDVASDRHAERLAARENKALSKTSSGAEFVLADLRAFSNRHDSDRLAKSIALGLKAQLGKTIDAKSISDRGYNQAIFHVLFVKMPAVLAELFFISNPREEKMLSEKTSREMIARGLFVGVRNFLASNRVRTQHANSR